MGRISGVAWTDASHGFWYGCHKVSAGCKFCYAEREMRGFGRNFGIVTRAKGFDKPLHWNVPLKVFVNPWSDFFIEEADAWRAEAWEIIKATPRHTYQVCTKRIERAAEYLPSDWGSAGYPNVWLGVTGEDQKAFDEREEILSQIPARVHWVSIEPQLERITITTQQADRLDWIVIGGESGSNAREFNLRWTEDFIYRKKPVVFIKQLGSNPIGLTLRNKHGANPAEWDEYLRVQEFPQ